MGPSPDPSPKPGVKTDYSCGVVPIHRAAPGPDGLRFLVVQHHAGHWGFPKGHPEAGESPAQAALRELAEETGITACELVPGGPIHEQYRFTKRSGRVVLKTVDYFLGRIADPAVTVQARELRDFHWGDAEATRARLSFDEGRAVLDAALAQLAQRDAGV